MIRSQYRPAEPFCPSVPKSRIEQLSRGLNINGWVCQPYNMTGDGRYYLLRNNAGCYCLSRPDGDDASFAMQPGHVGNRKLLNYCQSGMEKICNETR